MLSLQRGVVASPHGAPVTVLKAIGNLDVATVPELQAALARAFSDGNCRTVLDLSALDRCDVAGLGALLDLHCRHLENQGWIRLTHVSRRVHRLMAAAGVTWLPCYQDVPQALADEDGAEPVPRARPADPWWRSRTSSDPPPR